ncbi:MAG: hypothetical protein MK080_04100 [Opitutales bacterium]|nr:hypothetical protein [Opitutales bacterium]NRA26866.1 hypothetical protein [Opitutales bacterium]
MNHPLNLIVFLSFLCPTYFGFAIETVSHALADKTFEYRRSEDLTEVEKTLIGKWHGKSGEDEYEVDRKADGTYEIVYKGMDAGEKYVDYVRGIWWIKDGKYFYHDLESSYPDMWFSNFPAVENIIELTGDSFKTVAFGEVDPAKFTETSVERFTFELWQSVDEKD